MGSEGVVIVGEVMGQVDEGGLVGKGALVVGCGKDDRCFRL